MQNNYYRLLGISPSANLAEIKEATQNKIVSLRERLVEIAQHPQQAEMKELILEELQQIKTAYTLLSDPQQRQFYDLQRGSVDESLVDDGADDLTSQHLISEESSDISPYQPPSAPILDLNDGTEFELAGRGTRLIAHLIDNVIYVLPLLLFFGIAIGFGMMTELSQISPQNNGVSSEQALKAEMLNAIGGTLGLVLGLVYLIIIVGNLMLLYRNGQTIGKYLLAIKIVKVDGSRAGLARIIFLRAILFSFVSLIPFVGQIIYGLVDPLFIFQESRRCLHDLVAGTMVVKVR